MPMTFPDYDSLRDAARLYKFREPHEGEAEPDFRNALADHVRPRDVVASMEIRTTAGNDTGRPSEIGMMAEMFRLMRDENA